MVHTFGLYIDMCLNRHTYLRKDVGSTPVSTMPRRIWQTAAQGQQFLPLPSTFQQSLQSHLRKWMTPTLRREVLGKLVGEFGLEAVYFSDRSGTCDIEIDEDFAKENWE